MIWFFIFLVAFFAFFLYGLLRKPAEAGETFWGLFAFWRWFEERDDIKIGNLYLTSYRIPRRIIPATGKLYPRRWFNVILEHDDMQGDVYWMFVVILAGRGFKAMYWGNTSGKYTIPKFSFSLLKRLPVQR